MYNIRLQYSDYGSRSLSIYTLRSALANARRASPSCGTWARRWRRRELQPRPLRPAASGRRLNEPDRRVRWCQVR